MTLATVSPYGAASAVYTLSAGTNDKVLKLPIQPLVSSDAASTSPEGTAQAVWPITVPLPGSPIPGGHSLAAQTTLADVEFTLDYQKGDRVLLSSDAAGTKPFCVDGS